MELIHQKDLTILKMYASNISTWIWIYMHQILIKLQRKMNIISVIVRTNR